MVKKYTLELLKSISERDNATIDFNKYINVSNREENIEFVCNCGKNYEKRFRYANEKGGLFCDNCTNTNRKLKYSVNRYKNLLKQGYDKNWFIKKSTEIHGCCYDYSFVEFNGCTKIVKKINCKKHGFFNQRADVHMKGHNCQRCGKDIVSYKRLYRKSMDIISNKNNVTRDTEIKNILEENNCLRYNDVLNLPKKIQFFYEENIDIVRKLCKIHKIKRYYPLKKVNMILKLYKNICIKKIQKFYRTFIKQLVIEKEDVYNGFFKIVVSNYQKIDDTHYITKCGQVYSLKIRTFMSSKVRNNYQVICINNKSYSVHRLVAQYYIGKPPSKKHKIDHIDRNTLNNHYTNLRWVTDKENCTNRDSGREKYKILQYDLDNNYIKTWNNIDEIIKEFKCSKGAINHVCTGRNNTSRGYIWKYEDEYYTKLYNKKMNKDEVINLGNINGVDLSKYHISKCGQKIYGVYGVEMTFIIEDGYKRIILNNKRFFHHKIVNIIFNNGYYDDIVDHINGIKDDNRPENLESVTIKENTIRAIGKCIKQIDPKTKEILNTFRTIREANNFLGITGRNGGLGHSLKDKTTIMYGYLWDYCTDDELKKYSKKNTKYKKKPRTPRICQIDPKTKKILNVFNNAPDASRFLGKKYAGSHIGYRCRNDDDTLAYGYIWKYEQS